MIRSGGPGRAAAAPDPAAGPATEPAASGADDDAG